MIILFILVKSTSKTFEIKIKIILFVSVKSTSKVFDN